jgi:RNA polymerase primary sigma factor
MRTSVGQGRGMSSPAAGTGEVDQLRRQASGRPVLTAAKEVRLAKLIERGDLRAKDEMIERNLGLVFAVARPYAGHGVALEDLIQEGTIGLVRAVEKFDYRRGLRFSTYAVWWIRNSLMNALGTARTIRIPSSAGQQLAAIRRAETELHRLHGASVPDAAIAEQTGLAHGTVAALRCAAQVTASLDELVDKDGSALVDLIFDTTAAAPWERAGQLESQRQLSRMLRALPAKHREVLMRRYGLNGTPAHSHDEIAAWLGVGKERSRQIEHEALHRLRELRGGRERAALAA